MKRAAFLFCALAVCAVGCGGGEGASACAVLSDSTGGQLSQLDTPKPQIMIEARIVAATSNFSQSLGVDWDLATAVEQDNGGVVGGLSADFKDILARSGATGGVPDQLDLIPRNHNVDSFLPKVWVNFIRDVGDAAAVVALPPFACVIVDGNSLVPLSGFPGITLQNLSARDPGLTGAIIHSELLGDTEFATIMAAIQAESLNRVISAPRLTLYDGQRAVITVQDFEPALGRLNSDFLDAVTAIVSNPLGIFSGLTLDVTPHITADNRVIMDFRIGTESVSAFLSQQFDADGQPADAEFTVVQPSRAHTEIEVADGQTIFVGGLTRAGQSREVGVPVLKDLPLIGVLFGDGDKFDDPDAELLIFLTPRIIQPN